MGGLWGSARRIGGRGMEEGMFRVLGSLSQATRNNGLLVTLYGHLFIYTFQRVISHNSRFRSHGGKSLLNSGSAALSLSLSLSLPLSLSPPPLPLSAPGKNRQGIPLRTSSAAPCVSGVARRGAHQRRVRLKSNNQLKLREPQRARDRYY